MVLTFLALALIFVSVHSKSERSCEYFLFSPPPQVLWIRARVESAPTPGNAVQPLGLVLSLGIDGSPSSFSFMDELFGQGFSDEFLKQAIVFHQSDVPSALRTFLDAPFPARVLFTTWDCFTSPWCTSFISYFQRKGFLHSAATTGLFEMKAASASFCRVYPGEVQGSSAFTLEKMTRSLKGSGSHRELITEIDLKVSGVDDDSYSVMLVEFLPNTLFADTFQLQHLARIERFLSAYVYGDTDLERPAVFSRQAIVEVRKALGNTLAFSTPLHVRYAPLGLAAHSQVYLNVPLLLVVGNDSVEPAVWGNATSQDDALLKWPVPAGNIGDTFLVNLSTALAAVAGVIVLTTVTCLTSFGI